jgi:hypothetical protein
VTVDTYILHEYVSSSEKKFTDLSDKVSGTMATLGDKITTFKKAPEKTLHTGLVYANLHKPVLNKQVHDVLHHAPVLNKQVRDVLHHTKLPYLL